MLQELPSIVATPCQASVDTVCQWLKTSPAVIRKKLMQCCRHIVPVLGYTLSKILQSALTALFSGSDEPETLQSSSSG